MHSVFSGKKLYPVSGWYFVFQWEKKKKNMNLDANVRPSLGINASKN